MSGEIISSRRGELSILAKDWAIAAKSLRPLPNLHTDLSDEARVRSRYLDLIVREEARTTVRARAAVNRGPCLPGVVPAAGIGWGFGRGPGGRRG